MNIQSLIAVIAGVSSAIVAVDHLLARAESFVHSSFGPFVLALITRKPIRVQKRSTDMAFNFNTFMQNFGQVAQSALQTYEAKELEGKSLHRVDYINMAVPALFAILSAFNTSTTENKSN